ncbi:MAG: 50S ribosomal protein L4 [Candidatus Omnitrophota bacterium]|nr:MAG: 50S ribosomal protein L4 [Candidatus Omnitrophota bacterium]
MSKIGVLNTSGKEVEKIDLDSAVFDGKVNKALMQQAVVTYLANQRMGLASTKTRAEVKGSGRKPWRQKGTGRARVGSIRSPLWRGGGVTFGPKPRSFRKQFPKRMKALALKSALNAKLKDDQIIIVDGITLKSNKTKDFFGILKKLKVDSQKVRLVVKDMQDNLKLSCRNITNAFVDVAKDLNTYQALDCKKLLLTKEALKEIETRVKKWLQ